MNNIHTNSIASSQKRRIPYKREAAFHNIRTRNTDIPSRVGQLNEGQSKARDLIVRGQSLFLTGNAGTGKSFCGREAIKSKNGNIAVTAASGSAAALLGGQTLHNLLGIKPAVGVSPAEVTKLVHGDAKESMRKLDLLVIDEVSMVGAELFEQANAILQDARDCADPFGGVQLLLVGDFLQLKPINDAWAFESDAWKAAGLESAVLTESMRQEDPEFVDLLNAVRVGELGNANESLLRSRIGSEIANPIEVHTHRKSVERANEQGLGLLPGQAKTYTCTESGNRALLSGCPLEHRLSIKKGSAVVHLVNNRDAGLVNGSQGVIVSMREDGVIVEFADGATRTITAHSMEVITGWRDASIYTKEGVRKTIKEPIIGARRTQIPLRLGFASTVHKAQGQTYTSALCSLGASWEAGQAYVGLSRVSDIQGLSLTCMPRIHTDAKALAFMKSISND